MDQSSTVDEASAQLPLVAARPSTVQLSLRTRIVLFLYGVVMPLTCFAITLAGEIAVDQPWQSGSITVYAAMLLRPACWFYFVPWLLASLVSMASWTIAPRTAQSVWVRLGLYSGVILAAQFWIVVLVQTSLVSPVATVFVWPSIFAVSLIFDSLGVYYKRFQIWHLLALTTIVALIIAVFQMLPSYVPATIFIFPLFVLAAAPTLNLIAYIHAAWVVSHGDNPRSVNLGWLVAAWGGWGLGWLLSWRLSVQAMLDQYSRLPVNNPNCYFANAAAHGHAWLGGRRSGLTAHNDSRSTVSRKSPVATLAMKRLKFLELACMATAPRLHRRVRRYYDRWGKPAALRCARQHWFADLTCVALKPLECLAEIVRLIAGVPRAKIDAIYASQKEYSGSKTAWQER